MAHLDWALRYAAMGWAVLPLQPRAKIPLGALVPNGLLDASKDPAVITRWWIQYPDANIGIATGSASGFCALDVDPRHGGEDALFALSKKIGLSVDTITNLTGGGGFQYLYRTNDSTVRNSAGKLGPGLDIRGEGGYIVVPDSIHPSGNAYEWEGSSDPFEDGHLWADSTLLERCIAMLGPQSKPANSGDGGKFAEGKRNAHLISEAGKARHAGLSAAAILGALQAENKSHCAPHLGDEEVRKIAESVLRYAPGVEAKGIPQPYPEIPLWVDTRLSVEEATAAKITPACVVDNYLYADVALMSAPGGTGKTTLILYEALHIALGMPLYTLDVNATGPVFIVTAEDRRELLAARLWRLMEAMELGHDQRVTATGNIHVWDVSGAICRLVTLDDAGNVVLTGLADDIVARYAPEKPALVVLDPCISFGAGERLTNDNEHALVLAARRMVQGLGCCVRLICHTGKQNARDGATDQYASRGGSALPDGARMVAVLRSWKGDDETDKLTPPPGFHAGPDDQVIILARPKVSYAPPQPLIWLTRNGYRFDHVTGVPRDDDADKSARATQVEQFLISQLAIGSRYTKNMLEDADIMPQKKLRVALSALMASGRVEDRELPDELRQGGRKTYLHPTSAKTVNEVG